MTVKKEILTFTIRITNVDKRNISFDMFCTREFGLFEEMNIKIEDMVMPHGHFQAFALRLVAHVYMETVIYRKLNKSQTKILSNIPVAVFDNFDPQKSQPINIANKLKK